MRQVLFFILCFYSFPNFAQTEWQTQPSTGFEHYISSEYFDVYYSGENAKQAEIIAKYAEISRAELGHLYDYRPNSRYILLMANHAEEVLATHLANRSQNLVSGNINFEPLHEVVVLPNTSAELFNEVKQKVLKLMLKDFDYGTDISNIIQSSLLQYHPRWYSEGMSEYIAKGWNFEDEMWLAQVQGKDYLEKALTGNDEPSNILRKSIWFYIAHEYGVHKFSEILYITKITHSVESGLIASLGVTLPTFTERWREWLLGRIENNAKVMTSIATSINGQQIPLPKNSKLLSFSYNEKQQLIALFLLKKDKYEIGLYDLKTQIYTPTSLVVSKENNLLRADYQLYYPITWNESGTQFVTAFYKNNELNAVFYDTENRKAAFYSLEKEIQRIRDFTWSHDGKKIAASVWHEGRLDLVSFEKKEKQLIANYLTNDCFDDIEPTFSFDDEKIYFSSNRDTTDLTFQPHTGYQIGNDFDIFAYDFSDKNLLQKVSNSPDVNEHKPLQINSFEIYYLSDESGIWNLAKYNFFQQNIQYLTNWQEGILAAQFTENNLVFTSPSKGKITLIYSRLPEQNSSTLMQTTFRKEFLTEWVKQQANLNTRPSPSEQPQNYIQKADSILTFVDKDTMKSSKPRYYVYDDGKNNYPTRKTERKTDKKTEIPRKKDPKAMFPMPLWSEISLLPSQNTQNKWRTDYVRFSLCFNPVPRLGAVLGAAFTDMQKNHRFEVEAIPYFNLKNSEGSFAYHYLKLKPDFYIKLKGQDYFYQNWVKEANTLNDSILYRYVHLSAKVGVSYPLTTYTKFQIEETFHSLDRKDLLLVSPPNPANQYNNVLQTTLKLLYDKLQYVEGSPTKGSLVEFGFNHYYSLITKNTSFSSFRFQLKKYVPVYHKIVWANHLHGGYSFGNKAQNFYVGGVDNMLTGYFFGSRPFSNLRSRGLATDVNTFGFQEFVAPIRGFGFANRLGSKYAVLNSELRVPLRRSSKGILSEKRLYQFEWFSFADVGLIWNSALPFDPKEPADFQQITNGTVTVNLQTFRQPYLFSLGTGIKGYFLAHTIRAELAKGFDNGQWQTWMLSFALGRNF